MTQQIDRDFVIRQQEIEVVLPVDVVGPTTKSLAAAGGNDW